MQAFQFIEKNDLFKKLIEKEENKTIVFWLSFLASVTNNVYELSGEILDEKVDTIQNMNLKNTLVEMDKLINSIKENIKPRLFFKYIDILQEDYISFIQQINPNSEIEIHIRSQFSQLNEVYEEFINTYSYSSTIKFLSYAEVFLNTITTWNKVTNFIIQNLQQNYDFELDETLSSFSLFIDSDYTFKEFIQKLEAIQALYSELCFLSDISEVDFPLRIIKIESGSLWVKIFGESRVIETIISLIKDAKEYGYRNLTKEGKIEAEQQNFKALESALELRKKLQEANIDVEEFDEKIKKSSIVIMNNLNTLLSGEKKIKLNGELIESDDTTQKLLKGSKKYLLEGSKDAIEDNE